MHTIGGWSAASFSTDSLLAPGALLTSDLILEGVRVSVHVLIKKSFH